MPTSDMRSWSQWLFEQSPDGILLIAANGCIAAANPSVCRLLGYTAQELRSTPWSRLVEGFLPGLSDFGLSSRAVRSFDRELTFVAKDGHRVDTVACVRPFLDDSGTERTGMFVHDITARKAREERLALLKQYSVTDPLTGLLNRRGFLEAACHRMLAAQHADRDLFLLYADVDGFKQINDSFGHAEGDRVLQDVALLLQQVVPDSKPADHTTTLGSVLGRIGGDEFVLLTSEAESENAQRIPRRLEAVIRDHNARADRPGYVLSLSIGIARWPAADPLSLDEVLDRADRRMYRQKERRTSGRERRRHVTPFSGGVLARAM